MLIIRNLGLTCFSPSSASMLPKHALELSATPSSFQRLKHYFSVLGSSFRDWKDS